MTKLKQLKDQIDLAFEKMIKTDRGNDFFIQAWLKTTKRSLKEAKNFLIKEKRRIK